MAEDWESQTTSGIISSKLKDRVFDGAVICLHDAGEDTGGAKGAPRRTIDALIHTIPWLKAQGYQFLTMEQYIKGVDAHAIQQRKKGSYGRNLILMLLLTIITLTAILKGNDMNHLISTLKTADGRWLLFGLCCMFVFCQLRRVKYVSNLPESWMASGLLKM